MNVRLLCLTLLLFAAVGAPANADALRVGWQNVDGIELFYREGGARDAPAVVFLHGNPASSLQYAQVMHGLAQTGRYHVLAMDYPSFGFSTAPDRRSFRYTFDNIAATVREFLAARNIERYTLFMQDYGSNLPRYPEWQAALRKMSVPVLVMWGSRDDFFTTPGAFAYLRDAPHAEVHILDADHYATLDAPDEIVHITGRFLGRFLDAGINPAEGEAAAEPQRK